MGGVNQPRVENTITIGCAYFSYCSDFNTCLEGLKPVLMYFLDIVTLHDVIYVQNKGFLHPRLFILQLSSNKTQVLTLFWDESYHSTSIYHINKKKYNTTLQLTY